MTNRTNSSRQAEPPQLGTARYRVKGPDLPADTRQCGMMAASAVFNACGVMHPMQKNLAGADTTGDAIMLAVDEQVERVQSGEMGEVEAMLVSQAISLQSVYSSLTRRAAAQELLGHYKVYMTLGLKAQAQSRATLQTLIELKQPRHAPTFIKQANLANGPQQVNNGQPAVPPSSPAEENPNPQNKLLEAEHEQRLDTRAPGKAGRASQTVEAVGQVHRAKERRR